MQIISELFRFLIDTHCHFDDASFDADRAQAYARARAQQVDWQIIPAIHAENWQAVKKLCQTYTGLFPAYGLHPMYLAAHRPEHLIQLEQWLTTEKTIAVGECGLDFYVAELAMDAQYYYFKTQLSIAKTAQLPIIIHARRSVDAVIQCVRQVKNPRGGVVHSFAGSLQQAQQLIDLGYYLSFGGPITYPRANKLRNLIKILPLTALLLETDAPDQPLSTHRGQRNEPAFLIEIAQTVAELREQNVDEIITATTANAIHLFDLTHF